jgi:hypothetical protein
LGDCGLRRERAGVRADGVASPPIIERLSPEQRWGSLVFGLSVLAVVIMVRIAWLVVYRAIVATFRRWRPGLADRLASRDPRGASQKLPKSQLP